MARKIHLDRLSKAQRVRAGRKKEARRTKALNAKRKD